MTNEEIQKELAATLELSKKVYRMNHDEQYLIDSINSLSDSAKEKVYDVYKNASGRVKAP